MILEMPQLLETFRKEMLNIRYAFTIFIIAFFYSALIAYSINYRLVFEIMIGDYSLLFKIKILFELLKGLKTALSGLDFLLLVITALLSGINIALIVRSFNFIRGSGNVKFIAGGGTILGFISSGCASCGFSLLSVLGIGSVFALLPFGNYTLYTLSIISLLFSGFYMLKKLNNMRICKVL